MCKKNTILAETQLQCSMNKKLMHRKEENFCEFCKAELIIIFETSLRIRPIDKLHSWANLSDCETLVEIAKDIEP
jgi:hypothetical protein